MWKVENISRPGTLGETWKITEEGMKWQVASRTEDVTYAAFTRFDTHEVSKSTTRGLLTIRTWCVPTRSYSPGFW